MTNPGKILRALRHERGWKLSDVRARSGLPISTLSKIENGKMSLSYDKLQLLSKSLDIDISLLFGSSVEAPALAQDSASSTTGRRSIARRGEGGAIDTDNYAHIYPAADLLNKQIIPIIADLKARSIEEFGPMIRHSGEEYAFVLEGSVLLYTDLYAPLLLEKGDSIYFDSSMGHAYVAGQEGLCRVLSICSTGTSHDMQDKVDERLRRSSTPSAPAMIAANS